MSRHANILLDQDYDETLGRNSTPPCIRHRPDDRHPTFADQPRDRPAPLLHVRDPGPRTPGDRVDKRLILGRPGQLGRRQARGPIGRPLDVLNDVVQVFAPGRLRGSCRAKSGRPPPSPPRSACAP